MHFLQMTGIIPFSSIFKPEDSRTFLNSMLSSSERCSNSPHDVHLQWRWALHPFFMYEYFILRFSSEIRRMPDSAILLKSLYTELFPTDGMFSATSAAENSPSFLRKNEIYA